MQMSPVSANLTPTSHNQFNSIQNLISDRITHVGLKSLEAGMVVLTVEVEIYAYARLKSYFTHLRKNYVRDEHGHPHTPGKVIEVVDNKVELAEKHLRVVDICIKGTPEGIDAQFKEFYDAATRATLVYERIIHQLLAAFDPAYLSTPLDEQTLKTALERNSFFSEYCDAYFDVISTDLSSEESLFLKDAVEEYAYGL